MADFWKTAQSLLTDADGLFLKLLWLDGTVAVLN